MFFDFNYFVLSFIFYLFTFRAFVAYWEIPQQVELIPAIICVSSILLQFKKPWVITFTPIIKEIALPFLALFVVQMISVIINQSSLNEYLISFTWQFYGFFFFIAVLTHYKTNIFLLRKVTKLIFIILLLQIPIQILQTVDSPLFISDNPDHAFGSFGYSGTSMLASFFMALSYIFLMLFIFKRIKIHQLLIILFLSIISSFLADIPFLRYGIL
ncbi:hypothetical protein ACFLTI_07450, partial [Bacteroidota bacterium]